MNYYIDLIPTRTFLAKIEKIIPKIKKDISIVFNIYINQLPSMNPNELIYSDIKQCSKLILETRKINCKVNIMFDTYCLGNKEFTEKGKNTLKMLDEILKLDIDFITVTNIFFFNYLKKKNKKYKIIMSEYAEIGNVQKVCRYIEDLGCDAIKIDTMLSKDLKCMDYIKDNFDTNLIHIDTNKLYYDNNILEDALNNSIAHYIQDGHWEAIEHEIEEYKINQKKLNSTRVYFEEQDFKNLRSKGYNNFWYYYCGIPEKDYIKQIVNLVNL